MVANARGGAAAAGECMVSDSAGTGESYGGRVGWLASTSNRCDLGWVGDEMRRI